MIDMLLALKLTLAVEAFIGITGAVRVTPKLSIDALRQAAFESGKQEFSQVFVEEDSELRNESWLVLQNITQDLAKKKDLDLREPLSSSLQETTEYESGSIPNGNGARQPGRARSTSAIGGRPVPVTGLTRAKSASLPGSRASHHWRSAGKKALVATRLGRALKGLSGNDIYTTLKPSSPYTYARFKSQYDRNAGKLLQALQQARDLGSIRSDDPILVAISKVKQFRACDSLVTLSTDDETKSMFDDRWATFRTAWSNPTYAINRALAAEHKVNRVHVMENEIQTGRYFRTMNIVAQTFVLAVLLPSIDALIRQIGRPPKVMFAGCGLGDWAVETLLEFGSKADVTCYNYNFATMRDGQNLIRDASVAFDGQLAPADVNYVQQNLHYSCSEHSYVSKGCLPHPQGFFTFQLDQLAAVMKQTFDVVIYGNALTPQETGIVRNSLTDAHSFAIIPVCTKRKPAALAGGANCYCEGVYYKISKRGYQGPLFPFGHVMRPWGTEGGAREPPCTELDYDHTRLSSAHTNHVLERVPSLRAEKGKSAFDG